MNPITAPEAVFIYMLMSEKHYEWWAWVLVLVVAFFWGATAQLTPAKKPEEASK